LRPRASWSCATPQPRAVEQGLSPYGDGQTPRVVMGHVVVIMAVGYRRMGMRVFFALAFGLLRHHGIASSMCGSAVLVVHRTAPPFVALISYADAPIMRLLAS
jgi:hypothetical protein